MNNCPQSGVRGLWVQPGLVVLTSFQESVVLKMRMIRPDPVTWHGERSGEVLAPGGRSRRLTPVVGHFHRPAVSKFADCDVAVEAPVAVVARPLNDHHAIAVDAPANGERQLGEVALHGSDDVRAQDQLTHLWPLAFHVLGKWHAEDVGEPRRAIG